MVIIGIAEIDSWMNHLHASPPVRPERRRVLLVGGLSACLAAGLAGTTFWRKPAPRPINHRLEGHDLVALDLQGNTLWRYSFSFTLAGESFRKKQHLRYVQTSWIGDVDGDGESELLFLPIPEANQLPEDWVLHCFAATGELKWRFRPGLSAQAFPDGYQPPYCPLNLLVFDAFGEKRIAVASVHHMWHPSQIAVLSGRGEVVREYWHSGHLVSMGLTSSGPDQRPVLLAGGISNGYRQAVLVALDLEHMPLKAVSKEDAAHMQLPGIPSQETARILFPRSRISARKGPYNAVRSIRIVGQNFDVMVDEDLEANAEVIHRFGPELKYLGAGLSSNFIGRYAELSQKGLLQGPLRGDEEARKLSQIRWISEPGSSRPLV